jgi:hypothetical protein
MTASADRPYKRLRQISGYVRTLAGGCGALTLITARSRRPPWPPCAPDRVTFGGHRRICTQWVIDTRGVLVAGGV